MTTFSPKHTPNSTNFFVLAKRQTHLSVLVIATESAHQLAWKNRLRLVDMLEGLAQEWNTSGDGGGSSNNNNSSGIPQQQQQQIPFRSVNRSILLGHSNLQVTFVEPQNVAVMEETKAHELLQHHAALQRQDGNLHEELDMLEDQVDALLQDDDPESKAPSKITTTVTGASASSGASVTSASTTTSTTSQNTWMDHNQQRSMQLEQVVKDAYALTSPPNIPWLWRYRMALDHSTNHISHDLICQPALCLLVCSTDDHNPEDCFSDLSNQYNLPSQYANGLWDSEALRKEVLVLHDALEGPQTNFDADLLEVTLKQKYGPNAAVLRVNSINPIMAAALEKEEPDDIWNGRGKKGTRLSSSDRVGLRRYIANLMTTSVVPSLERRIAELNAVVTERKKGVRNVLRGLWRPSQSDKQSGAGGGLYRHDTIESQVRLLADTLFLIQDYETALSTYRLIRDDYKNDRALMHYASVQEMMALSAYLSDPHGRSREIFQYIETALFSYTRAAEEERKSSGGRPATAPKATRLATRLCLVLSSAQEIMTPERHLEVADLLASASSNETSLGAAVLLEQSSAHYYKSGMYRKYAFHMLMSGHMFRSAQQEHHAFRCFTSALYIYHNGQWDELHNHLRSALAAQLYSLGRMAVAVELYAKLVGTKGGGKVSTKSQQKFVNHLLEISKDHSKKALVGADRMAAPPGTQRQDRFKMMDRVLRKNKGAKRVLELPNIDLPWIDDANVTCRVIPSVAGLSSSNECPLGLLREGSKEIWEQLEVETLAEWDAFGEDGSSGGGGEVTKQALWSVQDPDVRTVLSEMDKERTNRSLMARAQRHKTKPQPAVRARMEPLQVTFQATNPLNISIQLTQVQLVARMASRTKTGENRICTCEEAINLPDPGSSGKKTWTFAGSEFESPGFARISTEGGKWLHPQDEPFFCVTKTNVTLKPGETNQTVALSLCPLVQGKLEVLGVRSKLVDGVWIYHPFRIQGPLLQNTQENRANRGELLSMKRLCCLCVFSDFSHFVQSALNPCFSRLVSKMTCRV